MNAYLLHALWPVHSGMHLWVEKTDGHKVIANYSDVPDGVFPHVIATVLTNGGRRPIAPRRARAVLATPKGRRRELTIPTVELTPDQAVDFLLALDAAQNNDTLNGDIGIAPDTAFILALLRGLETLRMSGRILFRMQWVDHEWIPMWQPAVGMAERVWLARMVEATPEVLSLSGGQDLADRIAVPLIDALVRRTLASMPRHSDIEQPLVRALIDGSPLDRATGAMVIDINTWRSRMTTPGDDLIFIVNEPDDVNREEPLHNPAASTTRPSLISVEPVPEVQWRVELAYRSGTEAPTRIPHPITDPALRQRVDEQLDRARHVWPRMGDYVIDPDTGAYLLTTTNIVEFIDQGADLLRTAGFRVLIPTPWAKRKVRVSLSAQPAVPSGPGDAKLGLDHLLDFTWSASVGDNQLTPEEMDDLLQSSTDLVNIRGKWVQADRRVLKAASKHLSHMLTRGSVGGDSDGSTTGGQGTVGQLRHATDHIRRDLREDGDTGSIIGTDDSGDVDDDSASVVVDAVDWISALIGIDTAIAPQRLDPPSGISVELREYQRRGFDWLAWMTSQHLGCILADDMGLGKTLQTLTLIAYEKERSALSGPVLVIAPTSVIGNWIAEAKKFAPGVSTYLHHGSGRRGGDALSEEIANTDIIVTTYSTATRDQEILSHTYFHRIVVDEAQNIKNPSTKNAQAVRALDATHRIALTGTPVENRLDELWAVMDFCNPGLFGTRNDFRHRYSIPIERYHDDALTADLKALTQPFILRRVKTDPAVVDDLPEKNEAVLVADMHPHQASLYKAVTTAVAKELEVTRQGRDRRGLVFKLLTGLKQICNHPAQYLGDDSPFLDGAHHRSGKVETVEPIIDEALTEGRKVLIFTQFVVFGNMLKTYLSDRYGIEVPFLNGAVERQERDHMVTTFNSPAGPPIMILSLRAGGTGLNLTGASVVIHMDRWWNPAVENQATDRAYRIGQDRDVSVYKIMSKGTIEERINDIIEGKLQLASAVVGPGEAWISELSDDELLQLVALHESPTPIRSEYTNARARYSLQQQEAET
ncbi:DEAD/DEAH box helicase [Corynebacterium kroppenstedtii]|uniref:DEAD/DEAH box helicase n=1 Tax=Corynebacterium sp. PCR 32 TaxID=3351342 RepID=UPI0030B78021